MFHHSVNSIFNFFNPYCLNKDNKLLSHHLTIDKGQNQKIIDLVREIINTPLRILYLNSKLNQGSLTDKNFSILSKYLKDNKIDNIHISINCYQPLSIWKSIFDNPNTSLVSKLTFGVLSGCIHTIGVNKWFGGDQYDPLSNTLFLSSDDPAIILRTTAEAKDYLARQNPSLYLLSNYLFPLPLKTYDYHQEAIQYIKENGDNQMVENAFKSLIPLVVCEPLSLRSKSLFDQIITAVTTLSIALSIFGLPSKTLKPNIWSYLLTQAGLLVAGHLIGRVVVYHHNKETDEFTENKKWMRTVVKTALIGGFLLGAGYSIYHSLKWYLNLPDGSSDGEQFFLGLQGPCPLTTKEEHQVILNELNDTPVKFNFIESDASVTGGTCSAMSLDFAARFLCQCHPEQGLSARKKCISSLAPFYVKTNSHFCSLQYVYNSIAEKSDTSDNMLHKRMQSLADFYNLKLEPATNSFKIDTWNPDSMKKEIQSLVPGSYIFRGIHLENREEIHGHTSSFTIGNKGELSMHYDPNYGATEMKDKISSMIYRLLEFAKTWNLQIGRFYHVTCGEGGCRNLYSQTAIKE